MSWKEKNYEQEEYIKVEMGENVYKFLDEGEEIETKYGTAVQFLTDKGLLITSSRRLLRELQKLGDLTGSTIKIVRRGNGYDTEYEVEMEKWDNPKAKKSKKK